MTNVFKSRHNLDLYSVLAKLIKPQNYIFSSTLTDATGPQREMHSTLMTSDMKEMGSINKVISTNNRCT